MKKSTIKRYNTAVKPDTKEQPKVPQRIMASLVVYGD